MDRIANKIALVTGSANGIGAGTAMLLAAEGAHVIATDIDNINGQEVVKQILDKGGNAVYIELDVSSEQAWNNAMDSVLEQHGRLDVLVNNAGIALIKPVTETTLDEWRRLSQINIDGVFLGMKTALRAMVDHSRECPIGEGGSIINMSSAVGITGVPGALAYTMSKAAIRHMSKSAALEFAEFGYNIRVNSIHPGLIETPMADGIYRTWAESGAFDTHDLEETKQVMLKLHPLGRYGLPEDIAKGVLFLASSDSSYMTGAELVIDGGYIAK